MSAEVRHPIFARLYARMSPRVDAKGGAEHRRELLAGLAGRVLELGAGNGLNFPSNPRTAALWQWFDDRNIYPRISGGCHAARDTEGAIRVAGFTIDACRRFPSKGGPVSAPHILGVARRASQTSAGPMKEGR